MRALRAFWVFPVSVILLGVEAATPPVRVSLRSSWPAPPFLVEVLYVDYSLFI
jgi:UDP-glucose:glycoprotein glucosyltransferase